MPDSGEAPALRAHIHGAIPNDSVKEGRGRQGEVDSLHPRPPRPHRGDIEARVQVQGSHHRNPFHHGSDKEIEAEKLQATKNEVVTMNAGKKMQVSADVELEFIRVQHSIVDCVFAAIHTFPGE